MVFKNAEYRKCRSELSFVDSNAPPGNAKALLSVTSSPSNLIRYRHH